MQQLALAFDNPTSTVRTSVPARRGWPGTGLDLDPPRIENLRGSMERFVLEAAATEWLRELRDERRLAPSTIKTYKAQLRLLVGPLPRRYDDDHLAASIEGRLGTSATGHQRYTAFVVLELFFRWWEDHEGIERNPLASAQRPPKPRSRRRALSDLELELLSSRLREAELKPKAEIQLMLFVGFRVGDVVNLLVEDVDFATMRIRCRSGKGGRDDWLPLSPTVARTLEEYLYVNGIEAGYVFPGPLGRMTPQAVWKAWRKVCGGQLQGLCPHQLRHSYCMALLRGSNGVRPDLNTVRRLMRHSSIAVTQLYIDDDPEAERAAILSLDERLSNL